MKSAEMIPHALKYSSSRMQFVQKEEECKKGKRICTVFLPEQVFKKMLIWLLYCALFVSCVDVENRKQSI